MYLFCWIVIRAWKYPRFTLYSIRSGISTVANTNKPYSPILNDLSLLKPVQIFSFSLLSLYLPNLVLSPIALQPKTMLWIHFMQNEPFSNIYLLFVVLRLRHVCSVGMSTGAEMNREKRTKKHNRKRRTRKKNCGPDPGATHRPRINCVSRSPYACAPSSGC